MADFIQALKNTLRNEGYVNDKDDPGGETYKCITRKLYPKWDGWINVDLCKKERNFPQNLEADVDLQEKINSFYQFNYWEKTGGSEINDEDVAGTIFDFAVKATLSTSAAITQRILGVNVNGVMGPETIQCLNKADPDHFLTSLALAKIARYVSIVRSRPESKKFFYTWVCRSLGEF